MWRNVKLKDICTVFDDGNWIETKDQSEDGIRLIQTGNVKLGAFAERKNKARYISEKTFKRLNCKEIFAGDILVSRLPDPVGRACIIPKLSERAITAVDCTIIRLNESCLPKYLNYVMQSSQYFADIQNKITGATRQRISRKNLGKVSIPLLPLPEQKRIVSKLDTTFAEIDELLKITRDASKNANILLKRHLTKIFSEGQKDWLTAEIGDLCESLFAGGDVQKNKLSKFKTDKFNVPIFTNGEKNKGLYGFTDKARVFKPSITVSARGTIGYSELRTEPFYPAVRLIVITPNTNIVETDYLKYAIKIISFLNTGSSIPQLTVPMVKKYKIKFPKSKDAQKKIVVMLDNLNSEITELINISKNKTEKYILLKKSILTQELNNKAA